MEALGARRGDLQDMQPDGKGRVRLDYRIPARGLIGFQSEFLTMTRGTGVMSHVFDDYGPMKPEITERRNGVLVSAEDGEAVAYALWKLQERGRMFVDPGEPLYEGMIVGLHSRDNDLVVNPVKTKQLTNIRAAGKDEAILLTPPIRPHAGIRRRVHRRRRAGRDHPEGHPHPQALAARERAQARLARRRLSEPAVLSAGPPARRADQICCPELIAGEIFSLVISRRWRRKKAARSRVPSGSRCARGLSVAVMTAVAGVLLPRRASRGPRGKSRRPPRSA